MISARKFTFIVVLCVLLVGIVGAPVIAQDGDGGDGGGSDGPDNIICSGENSTTDLGGIVSNITSLLVALAALVAIGGGAAFALASAARPGKEEYVEKRNKAVIYGASVLLVMYGGDAIITQIISEEQSISCVLPGVGG